MSLSVGAATIVGVSAVLIHLTRQFKRSLSYRYEQNQTQSDEDDDEEFTEEEDEIQIKDVKEAGNRQEKEENNEIFELKEFIKNENKTVELDKKLEGRSEQKKLSINMKDYKIKRSRSRKSSGIPMSAASAVEKGRSIMMEEESPKNIQAQEMQEIQENSFDRKKEEEGWEQEQEKEKEEKKVEEKVGKKNNSSNQTQIDYS